MAKGDTCVYAVGRDATFDDNIICGMDDNKIINIEKCEKCWMYKQRKPDMREKVKEYISELDAEIMRCMEWQTKNINVAGSLEFEKYITRIETLQEVRNDLKGRLEELV